MLRWAAVLLGVGAGCYEPPHAVCTILCTAGAADACPDGMTCEGGFCVAPGGSCTTALAAVRVGGRHACGLDATGHAACWGDGHEGQLGVGTINDFSASPVFVGDATTTWTSLATGNEHTCATKADGTVWCWGENGDGEVRGTHGGIANVPAQVAGPASVPAFDKVAAGGAHSCAIGEGQIWCWGHAASLGLPAETSAMTRFAPGLADFVEIAAGTDHSCAISASAGVVCFGSNDQGQAGQPVGGSVTTPMTVAVGLPAGQVAIHVATGDSDTCVIMADAGAPSGALWCWGYNGSKALGSGGGPIVPAKQIVPELGWTQVAAGGHVICGVRDHQAYCWGTETYGGVGDGVWSQVRSPAQAIAIGPADEVYVSFETPSAPNERGYDELGCLRDGDRVRCWGSNEFGSTGIGVPATRATPVVIASPTGLPWQHVWLSDDHTCAQTTDGALWCWGTDTRGAITAQLGHGTVDQPCTPTSPCDALAPVAAPAPVAHPERVVIGLAYTCALEGGAITCWGAQDHGVLGVSRAIPGVNTVTPPAGQQWNQLLGGHTANCGRSTNGTVSCWGHVIDTDRNSPMPINDPLLADLVTLQFGDSFACGAQTSTGRVCWGSNSNGQVGDGTVGIDQPTPMLYPDAVLQTTSRGMHSCALTTGHQIACWGYNGRGQCGQSAAMQQVPTPSLVNGAGQPLGACDQVATGGSFTCAICAHTPWCWGDDTGRQLGRGDAIVNGGLDEDAAPVILPQATYTEVAAGQDAACAIDAAGTLYCWGFGGHGELGDGSHATNLPTLIAPAS